MNIAAILVLIMGAQSPAQTPNSMPAQGKTQPAQIATKDPAPTPSSVSATYTNPELGLAFDYPKSWKRSKVKVKNPESKIVLTDPKSWRPAKQDVTTRFLVALPGVDEKATLEIYSVAFFQDEDTWQTIQRDINEKMNRAILRQWNDEVLGVPMLMTKIESKDKGLDLVTETGLLYMRAPRKMVYRITCSPDNMDKADDAWRGVLQSLRTTDGTLPAAEDTNRKLTARDTVPGAYHKFVMTAPPPPPMAPVKGVVLGEATAAGKKVLIRGPEGWKATKNSDGSFNFISPELAGSAKVFIASIIDSDDPGKVLIRSSGQTLGVFSKVDKREEKGKYLNHGQANVDWIYRRGLDGTKPHFSFDAAGDNGDNYWILTWNGASDASAARDRKTLESLADVLTVVPEP